MLSVTPRHGENAHMPPPQPLNVADRLTGAAVKVPDKIAVARASADGYSTCTFSELDADATALARALVDMGVKRGDRLVLLVRPGVEFVKLVFAMLRTGAVTVLVDPGMGRQHLVHCLAASQPDGFVATSRAQALRTLLRGRFPDAKINVTVGRRWFWGGPTYKHALRRGRASSAALPTTYADEPAAIIFTSGSTGPPKGVRYTHRMFDTQAADIECAYDLRPGGVDLSCFALFGLFNAAMGVTTVFPHIDFSRPGSADPQKLLAAANQWRVTQAFASPAVWDKLSRHCEQTGKRISTLRKVFSCGAPVPAVVMKRTLAMVHLDAEMHTPYGATEALPVATIAAREVLAETAAKTDQGAGICVGGRFDSIEWKIIRITDEPIAELADAEELPSNEIGELIVRGPQVSPAYAISPRLGSPARSTLPKRSESARAGEDRSHFGAERANAIAKICEGGAVWHRMGDIGYLDEQGRFWYCGRKSHRVETSTGTLYTECVEAVFNVDLGVRRTALVGVGPGGYQIPVLVFEPMRSTESSAAISARLVEIAQRHNHTKGIRHFLPHDDFPVDVRHNSKINREQLAVWAAGQVDPADIPRADLAHGRSPEERASLH